MKNKSSLPVIRWIFGGLAICLYVGSLTQNVWFACGNHKPLVRGIGVLAIGWLDLLTFDFAWLANLFIFWNFGRLFFSRRPGLISGLIGLFLALEGLRFNAMPSDDGYEPLCGRDIGIWLWISSAALLALLALVETFKYERTDAPS
jgi:hypothetical protein